MSTLCSKTGTGKNSGKNDPISWGKNDPSVIISSGKNDQMVNISSGKNDQLVIISCGKNDQMVNISEAWILAWILDLKHGTRRCIIS